MIPHNRPLIEEADVAAVEAVLRSGWIAQGPEVEGLEADFARYFGGGGACACSSGTAALFLALEGLGLGPGARVAVPSYACSALLNAVNMAGAEPVVCDVRSDDFCLDPAALPSCDAAVAVHAFGARADVAALARRAPLVVEDCCQSLGGRHAGRPVGAEGHAAVFSFYATKIITCGNGGLLWDSTGEIAARARDYRDFDCRREYRPRFNFLLSDFQARMAREQFGRIEAIAGRRRAVAARYLEAVAGRARTQVGVDDPGRMAYRFVLLLDDAARRDELRDRLERDGIQTAVPIQDWELLHRYLGLDPERFPGAERSAATTLSLPMHLCLNDADVDRVCLSLDRGLQ